MERQAAAQAATRELGSRIRRHREEMRDGLGRRVSQERVADLAGLHRTYIGHVERGEVNVTVVSLLRIAAALGVDAAELVRGLRI